MSARPLSPQLAALLRFIAGYQQAHGGMSPSVRECADAVGYIGKAGAHLALRQLEWAGAIRRLPHRARAIEILTPVTVPTIDGAPLFAVPLDPRGDRYFRRRS